MSAAVVTTESGSVYRVERADNGLHTVSWDQDGTPRRYLDVRIGTLAEGLRFVYEGRCERRTVRTVRRTTRVVSIEEVSP